MTRFKPEHATAKAASTVHDLVDRLGNRAQAVACDQQALALTGTEPKRQFLLKKIETCNVLRKRPAPPLAKEELPRK
jgi:predicted RNA polymerase sigma factor